MQQFSLGYLSKCKDANLVDVYAFIDGKGMAESEAKTLTDKYKGKFGGGPYLIYRKKNWGLSKHILEAMKSVFNAGYDMVCLLEDDVLPSRDFIQYQRYIHKNIDLDGNKVFAVVGYTKKRLPTGNFGKEPEVVRLQQWYSPDGVTFRRSIWNKISSFIDDKYYSNPNREVNRLKKKISKIEPTFVKRQWVNGKYKHNKQAGFLNALRAFHGMSCIMPCVSRCQDIGFYGFHQRQKKNKGELISHVDLWKKSMWYSDCWSKSHDWTDIKLIGKKDKEFIQLS